jgi:hypothetical protein
MTTPPTTSTSAFFGRLFWMMIGPLSLALTLYYIVSSGTGWRTFADVLFFVILLGMILGKWLEFRAGNPLTSAGEPATPANLRNYILIVAVAGPVVWLLANLLGNHLLASP